MALRLRRDISAHTANQQALMGLRLCRDVSAHTTPGIDGLAVTPSHSAHAKSAGIESLAIMPGHFTHTQQITGH